MKIVQKLTLVLFLLIICQYSLTATYHSHFSNIITDTIPSIEPEYKGNRIVVKSIKVIKKKGKSYKIKYKLVNNGRNKIKLGKPALIPKDLIIQFDNSLVENNLVDAKPAIIESIKNQSISIRPGQLILGNKMKFTHQPIPPSDRIAIELEKEIPTKKISQEKIVKNETPKIEESKKEVIHKTQFDKAVEDIVEEVPLPDAELENPRTPNHSSQKSKQVEPEETLLGETILVKENKPSNKLNIEEAESILEFLPFENPTKTVAKEIEKEEEVPTTESLENQNSNEKLCPDLMIEKVEILKKNKRFVLVNYTIKNVGNIPISLHGASKKDMDNIAIQSHFTRSHNLTRGSIPIDISYVKKGNKDIKGMMVPGESITRKLKVETSKVTRFTPVLALTINPSSTNFECSRLNNVFFIDIAGKAPESAPKKPTEDETVEKMTTLEN